MAVRVGIILGATLAALAVGQARANVTFSVSSVTLATGGTLSGTFTTNDARTALVSFDITAPAASPFAGFEYTTTNSTVASVLPSQYFRLDSGGNELQLFFTTGLSATGGALAAGNSYDHEPSGGNRFLGGTVTVATSPSTVPEPSSALVLGTAVAALGAAVFAVRRRFRPTRTA